MKYTRRARLRWRFVPCRTIRWMDGSARGLNDDSFAFEERMDRLRDR